jgi:hypothetical protein
MLVRLMACVAALFFLMRPAFAQDGVPVGQYVFLIDDSASMRGEGGPAADPDRLAMFAVDSLIAMLDDADQAAVLRLNASSSEVDATQILPLASQRSAIESLLALDGTMAKYGGQSTPCKAGFEAAKRVLNAGYVPGYRQTFFFLTDGECTGGAPALDAFYGGLQSAEAGLFQFYALTFKGRAFSRELDSFVQKGGGQRYEVTGADPASILEAFAQALSRSQGYESYLIDPARAGVVPAHQASRRVRLLAVAPDAGTPLTLDLKPASKGELPRPIEASRDGSRFQFPGGRAFQWARLDYTASDADVLPSAQGAPNWKIIALPEYRLRPDVVFFEGPCGSAAEPTIQSGSTGATVCAVVRVAGADGASVSAALARSGAEAALWMGPEGQAKRLAARFDERLDGFTVERPPMDKGDYTARGVVQLRLGKGQLGPDVAGAAVTFGVGSQSVLLDPASFALGAMVPGDERHLAFTPAGNFPNLLARLEVPANQLPSCVHVTIAGVQEGEEFALAAGQPSSLDVLIDPWCGAKSFQTSYDLQLRILPSGGGLPPVLVPVTLALTSEVRFTGLDGAALPLSLTAGESGEVMFEISTNASKPLVFALHPRKGGDDLSLFALDVANQKFELAPGTVFRQALRVSTDACCGGGARALGYDLQVAWPSGDGGFLRPTGLEDPTVTIAATVTAAGTWACWGQTILLWLGWIAWLIGLLLFFLAVRNLWAGWQPVKRRASHITASFGTSREPHTQTQTKFKRAGDNYLADFLQPRNLWTVLRGGKLVGLVSVNIGSLASKDGPKWSERTLLVPASGGDPQSRLTQAAEAGWERRRAEAAGDTLPPESPLAEPLERDCRKATQALLLGIPRRGRAVYWIAIPGRSDGEGSHFASGESEGPATTAYLDGSLIYRFVGSDQFCKIEG